MAKPSWVTINPSTGSGNGTVNVSGAVYTGRSQRTGSITYSATGVADVLQSVTQEAKQEYVTINNISAPKDGGNITITGVSNSSTLTFALGSGDAIVTSLPGTYSAGGASTANGVAIAGDPGATSEYSFSITLVATDNPVVAERSQTMTVTAAGGQSAQSVISQPAGEPTLTVSPASITLNANGDAIGVTVTSNTNWNVS